VEFGMRWRRARACVRMCVLLVFDAMRPPDVCLGLLICLFVGSGRPSSDDSDGVVVWADSGHGGGDDTEGRVACDWGRLMASSERERDEMGGSRRRRRRRRLKNRRQTVAVERGR
jgi:hypothetical protein